MTSLNTEWAKRRQSANYSPINLTSRLGSPCSQNLRKAENQVNQYINKDKKLDKMLREKPPSYLRPESFGLKRMFPNPQNIKKANHRFVRRSQTQEQSSRSPTGEQTIRKPNTLYKLAIEVRKSEQPSMIHTTKNETANSFGFGKPPNTPNSFSVHFSKRNAQGRLYSPYEIQKMFRDKKPKTSKDSKISQIQRGQKRRASGASDNRDSGENSHSHYSSTFGDRPTPEYRNKDNVNWMLDKQEQRKV